MPVVEYVRKKDFKVLISLPAMDGENAREHERITSDLTDAIYLIKPSFLSSRIVIEIRQPVRGCIANAVVRMCQAGIPTLRLDTLFPDQPALEDVEETHHIVYLYGDGHVVSQETVMCRDEASGADFMTHTLVALFKKFDIMTSEWVESRPYVIVDNTSNMC